MRATRTRQTITDDLERRILQALQNDFPPGNRPYETVAGNLQIPDDELCRRTEQLTADSVIRRMGGSLDSADFVLIAPICAPLHCTSYH
ncbi:MAG: hypothetical protein ACYS4W_07975 [Planctomycetota bacterium]